MKSGNSGKEPTKKGANKQKKNSEIKVIIRRMKIDGNSKEEEVKITKDASTSNDNGKEGAQIRKESSHRLHKDKHKQHSGAIQGAEVGSTNKQRRKETKALLHEK